MSRDQIQPGMLLFHHDDGRLPDIFLVSIGFLSVQRLYIVAMVPTPVLAFLPFLNGRAEESQVRPRIDVDQQDPLVLEASRQPTRYVDVVFATPPLQLMKAMTLGAAIEVHRLRASAAFSARCAKTPTMARR